ncbi:MAG: transcriptional regulator [Candidatus Saccharimonadaceae bacterium]
MIDALFGSKTRVKLLHLFLNNPGKSFYVREITRIIDEQINSVRRELSNLLSVGVITSSSADNKLYYEVNQRYENYGPFRDIFYDDKHRSKGSGDSSDKDLNDQPWKNDIAKVMSGVRVIIAAGILVEGSTSELDLLVVGTPSIKAVKKAIDIVETGVNRPVNYTVMPYDEFYYRLSVRDRFVSSIMTSRHRVIVDADNILKN